MNLKIQILISLFLLLSQAGVMAQDDFIDEDNCFITQTQPAKPNPSLSQCYKNNPRSCCNSLADQIIKNKYSLYTTQNCLDNFGNLEDYFCLACSPLEPTYTNHTLKQVRICASFLYSIWGNDTSSTTTMFDSCGLAAVWDNNKPILPSKYFNNSYEFINLIKPPFFEGYTMLVVDDSLGNCYAFAGSLKFFFAVFLMLTLFFYI